MAINFPKMHIAESVTNRILNIWDDLDAARQTDVAMPPSAPSTPQGVEMQSLALDGALAAPPPAELATPPDVLPPSAGSVMAGEPPIEGVP